MIADLYDFDKTIFNGESGTYFYLFELRRHPRFLLNIPWHIVTLIGFLLGIIPTEKFKEAFYGPLKTVDVEEETKLFWEKYAYKINPYFINRDKSVKTIVCSASPVFQIKPICDKLGVDLIVATEFDPKTGKAIGLNCKDGEKIVRMKKDAAEYTIRDVYTDNLKSDGPLLTLATRNKFHVVKGKVNKIY
ncbi:MAG: haloacid dehalogenase-like hydrolase [Clostridia bacterium]|nr:haloacid dehalogenase-like hydrolase [Clostridia bacterium]